MKSSIEKSVALKHARDTPDYFFDEKVIRSKQKLLKNYLKVSIQDKTVTYNIHYSENLIQSNTKKFNTTSGTSLSYGTSLLESRVLLS